MVASKKSVVSKKSVASKKSVENDEVGTRVMEEVTTNALGNYMGQRKRGVTKTKTFFAEGSKIKVKDVKVKDAVTGLKEFTVSQETESRDFVEQKILKGKGVYVVGSLYYQLMKPEKVAADKEILLLGLEGSVKGKVFAQGRTLLGLPEGEDVRVKPGAMGRWMIFVQSKSYNRKLPRGTKVLFDPLKKVSDKATYVPVD
jgi:hypothetical protein